MPVLTPALGPSLLKACVERAGYPCDLYYGSLEWLRMMAEIDISAATFDYSFIASSDDLGDAFFARALWDDKPLPVDRLIEDIALAPQLSFPRDVMVELADRMIQGIGRQEEFFERCVAARDWSQYRIIGFSSTFCQNVSSLVLARRLKEAAPAATIVFGGANCEGEMGEELLHSFPWVDAVIQGECDVSFPAYVGHRLAGRSPIALPGLLRRGPSGRVERTPPVIVNDLNSLPEPDFSDYFAQRPPFLDAYLTSVPVETSRGCWWGAIKHCTFCGLNPTGMTFRSKSPERALATFRAATDQWNVKSVVVVDNIFDMRYLRSLLPELGGLGLSIFYETKSNLREKHVKAMADAGIRHIQPGIESLNSEALAHMRKGARSVGQLELLKWCQIHGVDPLWFYLYRFPGEDPRWYYADIGLMERLWHLPPPRNPNPVIVDRFSPLFMSPDEFGLTNLRPAWNSDISYAGLPAPARSRLTYHFDADLPQGNDVEYELVLWQAVRRWKERYHGGAHLVQYVGDGTTLVLDGRDLKAAAYLLVGTAHVLYAALRTAQSTESLTPFIVRGGPSTDYLSARDFDLSLRAATMGAKLVEGPSALACLGPFLAELDHAGLVVHRDGRWLALATDPSQVEGPVTPHPLVFAGAGIEK